MQKRIFILAAVLATPFAVPDSASAQTYPWCAQYSGSIGATNCGFTSRQQCEANVRGAGGFCYQNPQWVPPAERGTQSKRRRNNN